MATPIEAPIPAVPPTAIEADAVATVAVICPVSLALSETAPTLCTVLESMWASVEPRITLVASAPAPLTLTPAVPPNAAPSDAAAVVALIVAPSVALSETPPGFAVTEAAPEMNASTSFEIWLLATATATLSATPLPPAPAASEAAPVVAEMFEVSPAVSVMLPADTPPLPLPAMSACTCSGRRRGCRR
jgi:hypothetical protein